MNSKHIGIEDARKALGSLVDEARSGDEIVLTRHGRPVARITPIEEPHMPTITEWIDTFRTFATVPTVVDTLGIEDRSPGLMDLGRAQLTLEAAPFAALIADVDAFFGDELSAALSGPEAAGAETEARRIIGEHLGRATTRLAVGAAVLPQTDWTTASGPALQNLAHVALQRAADLRFAEVVSPAARKGAA
jgi:prevent-host-death family protein